VVLEQRKFFVPQAHQIRAACCAKMLGSCSALLAETNHIATLDSHEPRDAMCIIGALSQIELFQQLEARFFAIERPSEQWQVVEYRAAGW
jgi:hypothetical protein